MQKKRKINITSLAMLHFWQFVLRKKKRSSFAERKQLHRFFGKVRAFQLCNQTNSPHKACGNLILFPDLNLLDAANSYSLARTNQTRHLLSMIHHTNRPSTKNIAMSGGTGPVYQSVDHKWQML